MFKVLILIAVISAIIFLISRYNKKNNNEPLQVDEIPVDSPTKYEPPVDDSITEPQSIDIPLPEISSPDSDKPFAKLSGNTVAGSVATEVEAPKKATMAAKKAVTNAEEKPKRTYKKKTPKPKKA